MAIWPTKDKGLTATRAYSSTLVSGYSRYLIQRLPGAATQLAVGEIDEQLAREEGDEGDRAVFEAERPGEAEEQAK